MSSCNGFFHALEFSYMKKLLFILLLLPGIAFAGGNYHYTSPAPMCEEESSAPTERPAETPATPPAETPAPTESPTLPAPTPAPTVSTGGSVPSGSSGGGGMLYCSGPMSPGWNVSLPGGGCGPGGGSSPTSPAPTSEPGSAPTNGSSTPQTPVPFVTLSTLPHTGNGPTNALFTILESVGMLIGMAVILVFASRALRRLIKGLRLA